MALTANRELNRYVDQELRSFAVAASERIWKGAFVGVDRTTGYVRNLQTGDQFAGIAYEEMDNSNGTAGAVSVRLYTQGDFVLTVNVATQVKIGAGVYAIDDEITTSIATVGSSLIGVFMDLLGTNLGIVRILPLGSQLLEKTLTVPLAGSTSATIIEPILITQRGIQVVSVEVSFLTVPDQGSMDVGTTLVDPDEIVNAFNLSTLSANTPATMILANPNVSAGQSILVKIGQASATAAAGGVLTMRYIELP